MNKEWSSPAAKDVSFGLCLRSRDNEVTMNGLCNEKDSVVCGCGVSVRKCQDEARRSLPGLQEERRDTASKEGWMDEFTTMIARLGIGGTLQARHPVVQLGTVGFPPRGFQDTCFRQHLLSQGTSCECLVTNLDPFPPAKLKPNCAPRLVAHFPCANC
jgi:hypothetical protein